MYRFHVLPRCSLAARPAAVHALPACALRDLAASPMMAACCIVLRIIVLHHQHAERKHTLIMKTCTLLCALSN